MTFGDSDAAGRAHAVDGGVYITANLLWLWGRGCPLGPLEPYGRSGLPPWSRIPLGPRAT